MGKGFKTVLTCIGGMLSDDSHSSEPKQQPVPHKMGSDPGTSLFECSLPYSQASHAKLPLKVTSVEFLGPVRSRNTYVNRDLGFPGKIGKHIFLSYGDTMWSNSSYSEEFRGMTSDSMALATTHPCVVEDTGLQANGYPKQFCPIMSEYGEEASTDSMGITSVLETEEGQGIVFFANNHRPGGVNKMIGAGVATVTVSHAKGHAPEPFARRLARYWWDAETEPCYGDVTALRAGDYIYAYGHAKDTPYVYVTRVHYSKATKLHCYEYWNGKTWQSERLYNVGEKEGFFWQIQQGQMVYSEFYQCFLFVYTDNFWNSQVQAVASWSPTGPWTVPTLLYQAKPRQEGGCIYSPAVHTYYDPSGKSVVITFTNHPNLIEAIKVCFTSSEA